MITGTYNQQYIPFFCLLTLWITFNYLENHKKASVFVISVLFFSIGMFTYSNFGSLGNTLKNRFGDKSLSSNHFDHPFFGKDIGTIEKVIFENRSSKQIPIVYLGNSSIEELSIAFTGIYTGITNISSLLQEKKFSIPDISTEFIIIVDARLNSQEHELISSMIPLNKSSYLLSKIGTTKAIHING